MRRSCVRAVCVGLASLAAVLAVPVTASAGLREILGYIEKMSGPGPFYGYQVSFDRFGCWVSRGDADSGDRRWQFVGLRFHHPELILDPSGERRAGFYDDLACQLGADIEGHDDRGNYRRVVRGYLSVEQAVFLSKKNDLALAPLDQQYRVTGARTSMLFFRRYGTVDVGTGLGVSHYSGTTDQSFHLTRVSIPGRLRLYPVLMVKPELVHSRSRWSRVFYLSVQADYYPQEFTAEDFGADVNRTTWSQKNELLPSVFLVVDLRNLFGH